MPFIVIEGDELTIPVLLQDSDGTPVTGVAYNAAGLEAYVAPPSASATLLTLTSDTWTEVGRGQYRLTVGTAYTATAGLLTGWVSYTSAEDYHWAAKVVTWSRYYSGGTVGVDITEPLGYLRCVLLDDQAGTIWTDAELGQIMDTVSYPFRGPCTRITDEIFWTGKTFLQPAGTDPGDAPSIEIAVDGTTCDPAEYVVNYTRGRILFAEAPSASAVVTATYFACDLYAAAREALLKRLSSETLTGQQTSVRLGPIAESVTAPTEMVETIRGKIDVFARFSALWRAQSTNQRSRVRL